MNILSERAQEAWEIVDPDWHEAFLVLFFIVAHDTSQARLKIGEPGSVAYTSTFLIGDSIYIPEAVVAKAWRRFAATDRISMSEVFAERDIAVMSVGLHGLYSAVPAEPLDNFLISE